MNIGTITKSCLACWKPDLVRGCIKLVVISTYARDECLNYGLLP